MAANLLQNTRKEVVPFFFFKKKQQLIMTEGLRWGERADGSFYKLPLTWITVPRRKENVRTKTVRKKKSSEIKNLQYSLSRQIV